MAKLYFKYGTMNSAKTAELLMTLHRYQSEGKSTYVILSSLDSRENGLIKSRAIKEELVPDKLLPPLETKEKLYKELEKQKVNVILIEEAQFLDPEQVEALRLITLNCDIPVICYGLKSDFKGELFPASAKLFAIGDSFTEIKTICRYCDRKANFNLKIDDNENPVFEGDSISPGYSFHPVCSYHFYSLRSEYC